MSLGGISYAVITPVRDDADNLARLSTCLTSQTLRPRAWIIVDDGSRDATPVVINALQQRHDWVRTLTGEACEDGSADVADGRRNGRVPVAVMAGLRLLPGELDVVVKLDADVSFGPDHLERLMDAFAGDARLGIASGGRRERLPNGRWRDRHLTGTAVEGMCRAYRLRCLRELLPFEERMGWDGIDELRAGILGWRTGVVPDLRFQHHRPMGRRDGTRMRAFAAQGRAAHYMGYRPTYLIARAVWGALDEPAALAMAFGFARAALSGQDRHGDVRSRQRLRTAQRLRHLPRRAGEATGRARHG